MSEKLLLAVMVFTEGWTGPDLCSGKTWYRTWYLTLNSKAGKGPPSWKCDAKSQIRLRQTVNRCETDEKWMTLAPRLHYALHVTDSVMLLVPHVHYHCLISWTQADLRSSIFNRRLRILSRRGSGSSRNSHKSNERSSSELRAVTNMSIRRNVDNY